MTVKTKRYLLITVNKMRTTTTATMILKNTQSVPIYAQTVAMGSDNALSCIMRRQKKKILGNVDCIDPLAFTIPDKLRIKNGEDIVVLYDSRTVRIGEKDVVLVFGSERTLDILRKNSATWQVEGYAEKLNLGDETTRDETTRDETTQDETTRDEMTRDETTRDETTNFSLGDETTRDETTRDETTQDETTRDEMTGSAPTDLSIPDKCRLRLFPPPELLR
ncbi:hypothetical protein niasHT_017167 [Heterodera trifolii]|uniref:Uncharacterized protein n=1 Tax=Heterodera trifolii TaxID=157864 RepID=A0ABD2L962_9BILA